MKVLEHYQPASITSENQKILISVIVAAYNIEDYIKRGLQSVCGQTYRNLEIIVVDDGSTDATGKLCDELAVADARIHVIHKENGGLADARNAGLAVAGGDCVGFVDGDDWIESEMYEKLLGALLGEQADIAVCRYRQVYSTHTEDASADRAIVFEGQEALQCYVEEKDEIPIQNAVWNKLFWRKDLKGLLFPKGKYYEDILFTTRLLGSAKRCVYLDTAYYNYIIDRDGSIMNRGISRRIFTDLLPAYREKTQYLEQLGRNDLAATHDYFVYKRLLLFYNGIKKEKMPEKQDFLNKITVEIKKDDARRARAYQCSVANPNEKKKIDIFMKSRLLYGIVMWLNEKFILPIKLRKK